MPEPNVFFADDTSEYIPPEKYDTDEKLQAIRDRLPEIARNRGTEIARVDITGYDPADPALQPSIPLL